MKDFSEVQRCTQAFADANTEMMDAVEEMKAEMEAVARKHQKGIKKLTQKVADKMGDLKAQIEADKALFDKPKTQTFSGVKVGYRKAKGTVSVHDEGATIELIKKNFKDKASLLIKTKESLISTALSGLKGDELKKIGVELTADYDDVVITVVDSAIEKITKNILSAIKEGEEHDECEVVEMPA